jgi:ABC-type branched-subunit amino acid transport system ATPase component
MRTSPAESDRPAPILLVEGLAAGYDGMPIVSEIDMQVGPKETVTIIGPNGAGKSTLLRTIIGSLPALRGEITYDRQPITNISADKLARIGLGYVPQVRDVFETLTTRENLELGGYLLPRKEVAERIEMVLDRFALLRPLLARTAAKLSGGERKLLAIGRVLMMQPSLLILDEPTANLSPDLARRVLEEDIAALAAAGMAILLVEQRAREALEISDWGYVLAGGRVHLSSASQPLLARADIGEIFLGQETAAPRRLA